MSDIPTPRTDAGAFTVNLDGINIIVVTAEAACKLERELAEAKQTQLNLAKQLADTQLELKEANRILDEAKKVFVEVDRATDERDQWREVAERAVAALPGICDEDITLEDEVRKLKEASRE